MDPHQGWTTSGRAATWASVRGGRSGKLWGQARIRLWRTRSPPAAASGRRAWPHERHACWRRACLPGPAGSPCHGGTRRRRPGEKIQVRMPLAAAFRLAEVRAVGAPHVGSDKDLRMPGQAEFGQAFHVEGADRSENATCWRGVIAVWRGRPEPGSRATPGERGRRFHRSRAATDRLPEPARRSCPTGDGSQRHAAEFRP